MRVAMIGLRGIDGGPCGGIESAVAALAPRLAARGHEVLIYTRRKYTRRDAPRPQGVKVRPVPTLYTRHLETIVYTMLSQLYRDRVELMHFHALGPALLVPVARLRGIPTLVTVHGLDFARPKWGPLARMALRAGAYSAATFPQATTVVSTSLQRYFSRVYGRDTQVIANGVELPGRADPDSLSRVGLRSGTYVLFLGRLVEDKGVDLLLRVWRSRAWPWTLALAGELDHRNAYHRLLKSLAHGDPSIRFLGRAAGDVKAALFHHAAAFVLPSLIEGLPIALLEAMSAGCLPVVSDEPGNLEAIGAARSVLEGEAAGVVFPRASFSGLRRALEWVEAHPRAREDIGARARELVAARYSWEKATIAYERVYQKVADGVR